MKVKSRKQNIDLFKIAIEMRNNIRTEIHNKVRNIFEDSDGDIWIATDGSICRYNNKTTQFDLTTIITGFESMCNYVSNKNFQ